MEAIQGNIIEQVRQAMAFVKRNIRMGAEIKGLQREEIWEYPLEALREAIINAVCHRDYTSTANVQIRIFDDRLEIWNPGSLPDGMTVADLWKKHDSRPRNRLIADAFFMIKYVEQFGTGIQRILDDCLENDKPAPDIEVDGRTFRAIFKPGKIVEKEAVDDQQRLASGVQSGVQSEMQCQILAILKKGPVGKSSIAERLGKSGRTRYLNDLVRKLTLSRLIERTIPDKPNSRLQKYRITQKGLAYLKKAAR